VAFIAVLAAITSAAVMISYYVSLKAAVMLWIILVVTIVAIGAVGAIHLRSDERFSEERFVKLMMESYRRLPLLRILDPKRPLMKGEEDD